MNSYPIWSADTDNIGGHLRLSDSFNEVRRSESDVEVRVRMINVNYGHNAKIMDDCKPLYEYSWFIETIRQYCHSINIENAVGKAIESMPEEYIIEQVCKKLIKGKDIETIVDELEEDVDRIRSICEIATKFAPDYNIESIYKALNENN